MRERRFTADDQERFAAFSGDRNPMHMSTEAARRTQAGEPAVHGTHALIWTLDVLAAEGVPVAACSVKADFKRFLRLDAPVTLTLGERRSDRLRASLAQDGARAATVDLRFPGGDLGPLPPQEPAAPVPETALDRDFAALAAARGTLAPPPSAVAAAANLFPSATAALGAEGVTALGLVSSLVGMVAPGLHSILSGVALSLATDPDAPAALSFAVVRVDDRFRLVLIDVRGAGVAGTVRSFLRFPPVEAPTLGRLADLVTPDEFADRTAVVIGGSRGLGAVTAKLLLAGGARVALSYHSGRAEAEAIRDEAAAHGCAPPSIFRFDAAEPAPAQLEAVPAPTHLYYFATGAIAGHGIYDRMRFDRFCAIYVDGVERLVAAFNARSDPPPSLFYPSSVFVESRPAQMTEYAMAKAAGEILCTDLARAHGFTASTPRLPRVLTDQTATVPPVPTADPVEVMLPLLRAETTRKG